MEEEEIKARPQDDVPEEVIHQYMLKDYQRMWNKYHDLEPALKRKDEKIKRQREKINELVQKLRENAIENLPEGDLKKAIHSLVRRVSDAETKNEELQQENEKLTARIQELKDSRSAVVEAVTGDLEEQLAGAKKQIELLKARNVVHTLETKEDALWMINAEKQLEKARERVNSVEDIFKDINEHPERYNIDDKLHKRIGKAIIKMDSCISHIECFFDKVGDIKLKDNETDTNDEAEL